MTFGSYNPRRRYIERDRQRNRRFLKTFVLVIVIGIACFWLGRQQASFQTGSLKRETEDLRNQVSAFQSDMTKLRAEKQTASSRLDQLQQQYQQEIPQSGPTRELFELVRSQISAGMPPERIAFVIRSARPPQNCTDPSSKRFMIKTPAYTGPSSSASFGDGVISVAGIGASSRNNKGEPQAWFDASQPVTLTFETKDGKKEIKTGVLPFQYSMIAAGREYRFTFSEGEKSFARVSFDSCDYP